MIKRKIRYLPVSTIWLLAFFSIVGFVEAQTANIKNDVFWHTKDGQPIYSQGGGIFRFHDPVTGDKMYYWYGVNYLEADSYRLSPVITHKNATFKTVTCYSSNDLVNWTFKGDVLNKDETDPLGAKAWVGRLGVAYIKNLHKYALITQHGAKVLFTLADSPIGPFKVHQEISMEAMIGTSNTGDQTVFTDEDNGKSYLIYSYGKGRNKIYVSEIGTKDGKVDLLDCTQIFKGESREGNCMFKYNKKYYMCASNIYGWDASFAYYLVADDIRGPYKPTNDMLVMNGCSDDFAHVSQTGFFVTIKGSQQETVVYCGDRWSNFAGNGLGYNQWCPLSFNGKVPYFNSLNSWNLNAVTGVWKVAGDNDYIKNGSFEADRHGIPSNVKPVQAQLTGWNTSVIEGNQIETNSPNSPVLNHDNSLDERKEVIGEKSMLINDKVDYKRKISQIITSSSAVKLADGLYTLTARVKNSPGFTQLEMYAVSNGKSSSFKITNENITWSTITLPNIPVISGKIEVGFLANGSANTFCLIDDISLVKTK